MGEFYDVVSILLEAFDTGVEVIRSVRRKRRDNQVKAKTELKAEEGRLSRSMKSSRTDVSRAYLAGFTSVGPRFANGDAKAHCSLAAILLRLNSGFVSIIDRFKRGQTTKRDYQSLVRLSNSSREDAISTFSQLSLRLSQGIPIPKQKSRDQKKFSATHRQRASKISSTSSQTVKSSISHRSKGSAQASSKVQNTDRPNSNRDKSMSLSKVAAMSEVAHDTLDQTSTSKRDKDPKQRMQADRYEPLPKDGHRMSMMTFTSGSTKLGEIPESRRWLAVFDESDRMDGAVFPLAPYHKPEKPKSRFKRFFGR